jgi:hypothetical protein
MTQIQEHYEQTLEEKIIREIQEIEQEYQNCQGLILSEDDLKCHLFRRIYDLIPSHNIRTANREITGSPLHTEIRFYNEEGKLTLIPDITILDPAGMSIKHGMSIRIKDNRLAYGKLPSKGFEFGGKAIVIEIKFEKSKNGIPETTVQKIREDLEKITGLMERPNRPDEDNKIYGIMVVFNKTNSTPQSLHQLFEEYRSENLAIVYGTGNVSF